MKVKITNKTGMRLRYKDVKFEPRESKELEIDSIQEHEYFDIEKLDKHYFQKVINSFFINSLSPFYTIYR